MIIKCFHHVFSFRGGWLTYVNRTANKSIYLLAYGTYTHTHTLQAIITPHNTVLHSLWPIIPLRSGLVMNIANRRTVHSSLSLWLRLVFLFFLFLFQSSTSSLPMTDDGSWVSMMMMVVVVMLMSLWSLPAIQPTGHQLWNGQFATKNNTRHFLGEAIGWSLFLWKVRITSILPLNAKLVRSSGSCGDGDGVV